MNNKKVSIIVPVFNEKKNLEKCISSIANQTYCNIEIILVDDGSDSITAEMCDLFSKNDNRIVVIHQINKGLSEARLSGLKVSTGDWIMFSDHDDLMSPIAVESMIEYTEDNSVDIVSGKRLDFVDGDYIALNTKKGDISFILGGKEACEKIHDDKQNNIITPLWGKIYRKSFLASLDLTKYKAECPVIFFEDILMTPIIFSNARKIVFIDAVFYYHRELKTSISRCGKISEFYIDQINSGLILLNYSKKNGLSNFFKNETVVYIDSIIRIWCLINIPDKKREKELKKRIRKNFKLFFRNYFKTVGFSRKIVSLSFLLFPYFTCLILRNFYFKRIE